MKARRLASMLAGLWLAVCSAAAVAADEAALARVSERLALAAGPWCDRASELGADGRRRCRLDVKVLRLGAAGPANALQFIDSASVSEALLAAVDDDELAFVLGHEIAHFVLGHGRQRLRGAGAQAVALDDLLKSVQPPPHADAAADPLAQEFDADALGLLLAMRAGHPAAAAMRLFRRIGTLPSWEGSAASATHPAPAARVAALAHHAAQGCRLLAGGQALLPTEPRLLPPAEYRQMEAREAPESRPPGKVCAGVPLEPTRRAAMPFAQPFSLGRHVPDGACPHCNPR